ncbi:MAG TPA: extracellular solute-binding protein, partial [Limnochordia bacterium]|nr:extracellular solute-binding protein [Limnochordia bacterium]
GLVEPHVGWTWNDMADLAQKLTKRGVDGKVDVYGTYIDTWPLMLYNFIYGAGGQLFDDESTIFPGKAVYNGPKAVEGLQFYTDLATKMDVAAPPNIGGRYPFGKGKLGFLHTGDHVLSDKNFMGGINYGATIAPIGPNGKQFVAQAGGTGYGLAAGSKHPELAWELMQALMSEPVLKSIGETDSAIITRLSVQRELSPDLWANKLWREGGAYFRPVPVVGFNDVLAAPLGKAMQDVTVKHVPLVQALDTAVQASNVALADWKQKIAQAAAQ